MTRLEILLVDDDPLVRHVIADELEEAGHFVTPVVGGDAALETLQSGAAFDLVLIDYTMPGMTGAELAKHIRAFDPSLRLAILTGHAELPESAPCPVLIKGLRMTELVKAIESIAAGEEVSLPHNATSSRVELVIDQVATKPTVGGVRSAIGATYTAPEGEAALPEEFASLLERLPDR